MDLKRRTVCLFCILLSLSLSPGVKSQNGSTESNASPTAETSSPTSHETATSSTEPQMTSSAEPVTSETTAEPQTTMPTTPSTQPPKQNHYEAKDGNITCLVMDATFVFEISYLHRLGQMMTKTFSVPPDATSNGQCISNQTEVLDISFFDEPRKWKLHIDIERAQNAEDDDILMADGNVNYSWEEVTLTYYEDKEHFPDAEMMSNASITVTTSNDTHLFEASSDGSYKCSASQNIKMEAVKLEVSDFQYRAFGETSKGDYPDSGKQECPADKKDDDDDTGKIVGIVVGSVVGGLILLTVIGCLIQKARKRGSYEKV